MQDDNVIAFPAHLRGSSAVAMPFLARHGRRIAEAMAAGGPRDARFAERAGWDRIEVVAPEGGAEGYFACYAEGGREPVRVGFKFVVAAIEVGEQAA